VTLEIKGLPETEGSAELAEIRAKEAERVRWLLAVGVRFFHLIKARGGNIPGRLRGDKKKARRKKVALARKADRSRRARGS